MQFGADAAVSINAQIQPSSRPPSRKPQPGRLRERGRHPDEQENQTGQGKARQKASHRGGLAARAGSGPFVHGFDTARSVQ